MDKKIFLVEINHLVEPLMKEWENFFRYWCVSAERIELTPELEEKIKNELVAIYQEQGMDDLATAQDIVDDVFQKLKDTLLKKGCIENAEVDKNG